MRSAGWFAILIFVLAGCAAKRAAAPMNECVREQALTRGLKDGASGRLADFAFLRSCTPASRVHAAAAYREGFESSRPKRAKGDKDDKLEVTLDLPDDLELLAPPSARGPAAQGWVCEVEANSKIFTGVGTTKDEALGSARASCGKHFQASYCGSSDCKPAL